MISKMKMVILFLINALHFHHNQDDHHNFVHEKSPYGDVTKYDNNEKKITCLWICWYFGCCPKGRDAPVKFYDYDNEYDNDHYHGDDHNHDDHDDDILFVVQ